jgi:hypothetical protein
MRALVGGPAGMAIALALLTSTAAAQGGATTPSPAGGSQYGAPIKAAKPARPVARYFRLGPRPIVAPAVPKIALRIEEPGASTVKARIVFMPQTETGSIVRIDLGRIPVGQRFVVTWPSGTELQPGRYRVRLHVRGLRGAVLARKATAPGRATLTVRAPEPAPVALPDPAGHVFPVNGPHTYGDAFGAARKGYSHQGQDLAAAEGTPVVAPRGGIVQHVAYQAEGAGHYVILDGEGEERDYAFMHLRTGSIRVAEGQRLRTGQLIGEVGNTGRSFGAHLHFEVWEGGDWWNGGKPVDPLPYLQRWASWLP